MSQLHYQELLQLLERKEDAVAQIDLIYWAEYQDYEVMATWIDKYHDPIEEQYGDFSIKEVLMVAD